MRGRQKRGPDSSPVTLPSGDTPKPIHKTAPLTETLGPVPLIEACAYSTIEEVRRLLDEGADLDAIDGRGTTALITAASKNRCDIVSLLVDRGAAIDQKDKNGRTALMAASAHGYEELTGFLIVHGADPHIMDNSGQTAEQMAEFHGARKIATEIADTIDETGLRTQSSPPLAPFSSKPPSK